MKSLHKPEVWQKVLDESQEKPVVLLKHSNTCPVSGAAHKRVKKIENQRSIEESFYILIVQNAPDISELVADDLGVEHESPQLIVIADGEAAYHASHADIQPEKVVEAIKEAR